ncbi:hypothetical protein CC1G_11400 [Coprinopsis cinerea okayama7|uniref:HMG box domain-containing protein n=1 Tax=Coprinopsis cinerea (strain Okayama-7 / 130 / ATCC MYA-4618 / FGSC 9003) TaxID=240176 RepID=A8PGL1_COPC7|nr:hypothetical protein CC1G_11400 [Coprinopsis cinerea okayama7\|eukprot:XP_001841237.1 hypothetical protein CC1G_11400 [Coprinopsis cinerea okayama7\
MPKIDISEFDQQRAKLASGLIACAEQLRNTAQIAEDFAKILGGLDGEKGKHKDHGLEDGDGGKKRKRAAKPKDPNAPKRPASSYILFQNEVRNELKRQNPNLTNPELLTLISEKWKNMTDEQKETYNQQMLKAKEEYSQAKNAYDNRSPEEVEAANRAAAEAAASKKANKGARGKSNKESAPAAPPPPAREVEPEEESDEEESEDDDEEEESKPSKQQSSSEESDSSEAESEPAPKKRRAESDKSSKKSSKKSKA